MGVASSLTVASEKQSSSRTQDNQDQPGSRPQGPTQHITGILVCRTLRWPRPVTAEESTSSRTPGCLARVRDPNGLEWVILTSEMPQKNERRDCCKKFCE